LADAGGIQQQAVDGDGAFVVQLRMGDGCAVDLGLEQAQVHEGHPGRGAEVYPLETVAGVQARATPRPARAQNSRLSISRVRPSLAATSATRAPSSPSAGSIRSGRRITV